MISNCDELPTKLLFPVKLLLLFSVIRQVIPLPVKLFFYVCPGAKRMLMVFPTGLLVGHVPQVPHIALIDIRKNL